MVTVDWRPPNRRFEPKKKTLWGRVLLVTAVNESCVFSMLFNISYLSYHLLTWIPLVLSRANIFSCHIFSVFCSPNCSNSFVVFLWISWKTNFFNAKTLSYAYLWVKEIAEKLEKFDCWMVKWSSRKKSFEDLETKEKTKSGMNKAVKIVLRG